MTNTQEVIQEQPQGQLQEQQKIDPKLQKQMDSYIAALMYSMHNPKTSGNVLEMLKSAPPEQSIPYTAIQLNSQVEQAFSKKLGGKVDDSVKLAGAMYLASDLSELGNAAKLWETPVTEKDVPKMFQGIVTKYIHNGLRDGSIDPIQLQKDIEPLMNDKQRQIGQMAQQKLQLPDQPTESMGVDMYLKKKMAPVEQENQKLKGMLQGVNQQQQQVQQQQQQADPVMQALQRGIQ